MDSQIFDTPLHLRNIDHEIERYRQRERQREREKLSAMMPTLLPHKNGQTEKLPLLVTRQSNQPITDHQLLQLLPPRMKPTRINKLYRCPITPAQQLLLEREKAFVLDGLAVSARSRVITTLPKLDEINQSEENEPTERVQSKGSRFFEAVEYFRLRNRMDAAAVDHEIRNQQIHMSYKNTPTHSKDRKTGRSSTRLDVLSTNPSSNSRKSGVRRRASKISLIYGSHRTSRAASRSSPHKDDNEIDDKKAGEEEPESQSGEAVDQRTAREANNYDNDGFETEAEAENKGPQEESLKDQESAEQLVEKSDVPEENSPSSHETAPIKSEENADVESAEARPPSANLNNGKKSPINNDYNADASIKADAGHESEPHNVTKSAVNADIALSEEKRSDPTNDAGSGLGSHGNEHLTGDTKLKVSHTPAVRPAADARNGNVQHIRDVSLTRAHEQPAHEPGKNHREAEVSKQRETLQKQATITTVKQARNAKAAPSKALPTRTVPISVGRNEFQRPPGGRLPPASLTQHPMVVKNNQRQQKSIPPPKRSDTVNVSQSKPLQLRELKPVKINPKPQTVAQKQPQPQPLKPLKPNAAHRPKSQKKVPENGGKKVKNTSMAKGNQQSKATAVRSAVRKRSAYALRSKPSKMHVKSGKTRVIGGNLDARNRKSSAVSIGLVADRQELTLASQGDLTKKPVSPLASPVKQMSRRESQPSTIPQQDAQIHAHNPESLPKADTEEQDLIKAQGEEETPVDDSNKQSDLPVAKNSEVDDKMIADDGVNDESAEVNEIPSLDKGGELPSDETSGDASNAETLPMKSARATDDNEAPEAERVNAVEESPEKLHPEDVPKTGETPTEHNTAAESEPAIQENSPAEEQALETTESAEKGIEPETQAEADRDNAAQGQEDGEAAIQNEQDADATLTQETTNAEPEEANHQDVEPQATGRETPGKEKSGETDSDNVE